MNCSPEWLHELTGGEHREVADCLWDLVLLGHQKSVATHENFLIILEEMHKTPFAKNQYFNPTLSMCLDWVITTFNLVFRVRFHLTINR